METMPGAAGEGSTTPFHWPQAPRAAAGEGSTTPTLSPSPAAAGEGSTTARGAPGEGGEASRRRDVLGALVGLATAACGTPSAPGPPVTLAITGRPIGMAPVLALLRPPADLAAAVPATVGLPPLGPLRLRVTTTFAAALDLVARGHVAGAVVPRGVATGLGGWKVPDTAVPRPTAGSPLVAPANLGGPGPLRLVVRRESVAGPRLPNGRLARGDRPFRDRPFRFAYAPPPWGLPVDALVGGAIPDLLRATAGSPLNADGLPLGDGGRWQGFETEVQVVTALVDDRADAAVLWPEGAAYALRNPAFALAATLPPRGEWADGMTPVIVGTIPPALEAWVTALGAALDGPAALALLRLALPERDPLTLAGAVALRREDWLPQP